MSIKTKNFQSYIEKIKIIHDRGKNFDPGIQTDPIFWGHFMLCMYLVSYQWAVTGTDAYEFLSLFHIHV